jgi:hypothetical protein
MVLGDWLEDEQEWARKSVPPDTKSFDKCPLFITHLSSCRQMLSTSGHPRGHFVPSSLCASLQFSSWEEHQESRTSAPSAQGDLAWKPPNPHWPSECPPQLTRGTWARCGYTWRSGHCNEGRTASVLLKLGECLDPGPSDMIIHAG